MARISGVNLPGDKRIEVALTYIYGVGLTTSQKILAAVQIDPSTRTKELNKDQVEVIRQYMDANNIMIEGDLKRKVLSDIKRLKEISSYRGTRHAKNLPSRGQRSKTNSRTVRGNKRSTMGSGRKPAAQKT